MKKNFLEEVNDRTNNNTLENITRELESKVRKEDKATRRTFLIDDELLLRLDSVSDGKPKGTKTKIVEEALRRVLDEIEGR